MCPLGSRCYIGGGGCSDREPCEFDTDCGGNGIYCDGQEVCVTGFCESPALGRECGDMNSCTVDMCVESSMSCARTPYTDFLTNVTHCGTGTNDCVMCPMPAPRLNQLAACTAGACALGCAPGFTDRDMNPANGCEYSCTPTGTVDLPDDMFRDANCDGIDGDRARAVFISNLGSDGNDGLTPETPVATVTRALNVATVASRSQVLFVTASYSVSTPVSLRSGISLYGGYSADFAARTDTRASLVSSDSVAVRAQSLTSAVTMRDSSRSISKRRPGLHA